MLSAVDTVVKSSAGWTLSLPSCGFLQLYVLALEVEGPQLEGAWVPESPSGGKPPAYRQHLHWTSYVGHSLKEPSHHAVRKPKLPGGQRNKEPAPNDKPTRTCGEPT